MVALAEAASYLALLGASVLKRTSDLEVLVTVIGPIHGVLFLAYLGLALYVRAELEWPLWTTLWVAIAAVVPLGGLIVERRLPDAPAVDAPRVGVGAGAPSPGDPGETLVSS